MDHSRKDRGNKMSRSLRGVVRCLICKHAQSYISQTPIQPGKEHTKRREAVCLKCEYRHQFTVKPQKGNRGKTSKVRFVRFPSHTPREFLIEHAQRINMKNSKIDERDFVQKSMFFTYDHSFEK